MTTVVIDKDGNSLHTKDGAVTRSDHPVFQARIEMALNKGKWLHAPSSGHNLKRFATEKQSNVNEEEYEKEARTYLRKYSPSVVNKLSKRGALDIELEILDGE